MPNFRALRMGIAFVCVLATIGCTGMRDSGTPTFFIPIYDQYGEHFQMVQLTTLTSPYRMEGAAARVFFNPSSPDGQTISGNVAEPEWVRSGNTFVPRNTASGTTVALYAFYEKMLLYEKRVLLESEIRWPRTIAVYKNVRDLPPGNEGNAAYKNRPYDITAFMPFDSVDKVSMSINPGAEGHEHYHAHFDAFVRSGLVIKNLTQEDGPGILGCPGESAAAYQLKMLRTWDEGLADTYGVVTSGMPEFMLASLPENKVRKADQIPERMKSNDEIRHQCFSSNSDEADPYFNAEQILRALYAVADHDQFPPLGDDAASLTKWERAARYIIHRTKDFKAAIQAKTDWINVPPEFGLCFFLKESLQQNRLSPDTIQIVNKAFSQQIANGVLQCATL